MGVEELTNPLLAGFWNETRLRSSPETISPAADHTDPGMSVQWTRIAEALGLGYGERSGAVITKGKTLMRARTTPSAGALYPFEVLVAFQDFVWLRLGEHTSAFAAACTEAGITAKVFPGEGVRLSIGEPDANDAALAVAAAWHARTA
ncbi:hypothetical protein ACIGXI_01575 [Kitasatospora aureofaciens]|uniref:hypothetical protein n=1 Tax=Kitasatospora aureofaciens TaxID=1894 RepID=UPI0037C877A4